MSSSNSFSCRPRSLVPLSYLTLYSSILPLQRCSPSICLLHSRTLVRVHCPVARRLQFVFCVICHPSYRMLPIIYCVVWILYRVTRSPSPNILQASNITQFFHASAHPPNLAPVISVTRPVVAVIPSTFRSNLGESMLVTRLSLSRPRFGTSPQNTVRSDPRHVKVRLLIHNSAFISKTQSYLAIPKEVRG